MSMSSEFESYEKISDTLMWFNQDVVLRFNVSLARKDKKGRRTFFWKEWSYDSKYPNAGNVVSIKREIRAFLSIENIRYNNGQGNLMIERGDMPMLRSKVTEAAGWITSKKVFSYNKDHSMLQIISDVSCSMNLGCRSALKFEPVIIIYDNSAQEPGIRMCIGDTQNFIDIKAVTFMEFYEILRTLDIYTAACAVISSIPIEHEDTKNLRGEVGNIGGEKNNGAMFQNRGSTFFDK